MRSIFGALVVLALAFGASLPASADQSLEREIDAEYNCVSVSYATFADSLRIIANGGREIALGFTLDEPGEGVGLVVYIAPEVCASATGSGQPPLSPNEPAKTVSKLDKCPTYPALP